MKEIKKEIVRHIGVISESTRGWQLELNMVRWDDGEPSSSSPVTSRVTPVRSSREPSACSAMARPVFMSKLPGPRSTPSATSNKGYYSKAPVKRQ